LAYDAHGARQRAHGGAHRIACGAAGCEARTRARRPGARSFIVSSSLREDFLDMVDQKKLVRLREGITESLRVQRGGGELIGYIDVGHTLNDACARQNHAIFARRGCGKTLLLHASSKRLRSDIKPIYLNCEDFKRHTFPNVLIEILAALFREIEKNLPGWFGQKKKSRQLVSEIVQKLKGMHRAPDIEEEDVKRTTSSESADDSNASVALKSNPVEVKTSIGGSRKRREETERTYRRHKEKLHELDQWLPELKERIRDFFELSESVKSIFLQIDDLYHLRRADQAFVMDYIHRLCKDLVSDSFSTVLSRA
jgi:Cdc6-like AAA superfamily ATPase